MAANLPSNGTILTQDEYGRGSLPKGAERIYGKPTKHDKIGHFIDSRSGNVETIAYRMPEPKKPAKAGEGGVGDLPDAGDTDAVVVKLRPDLTQKGLGMVGDFRTDALQQALDDASIPTETLIGLLVLALGAENVTVETGRVYGTGDREVIRDRISEGGVLTADHDVLHAAARDMLKIVLSCRANMTDNGVSSRVTGETLGAAAHLPTMATDEFLSCLSRQALERSATADGMKVEVRVKDTRAALVNRFGHVYCGDPSRPRFRAPLGAADLEVRDGDVLLAVDGHALRTPDDPYRLLAAHDGPTRLTLSGSPDGPRRDITVDPVPSEVAIRQLDWIDRNRARVDALSHGQVGYVYLGNFNETGTEDFDRQYYAQTEKKGLVFDERWNNGGFTSQWVISVLRRIQEGVFRNREGGVSALPGSRPPPSMAVITNIFAASDGDQFPYFMKREHLATIFGERTWGGVAGIAGPWPLINGVTITIPKDRLFANNGQPIIENWGAEPDVRISDIPAEIAAGIDSQLDHAVNLVLQQSRDHDASLPRAQ